MIQSTAVLATALLLVGVVPVRAQTTSPPKPAGLEAIAKELADSDAKAGEAAKALRETDAYKAAQKEGDRAAIDALRASLPKVDRKAFAEKAVALGETLKGDDRARCLVWAIANGGPPEVAGPAFDALVKDHGKSPAILELTDVPGFPFMFSRLGADKAEARIAALRDASDLPIVKAWATYADSLRLTRAKGATEDDKAKAAKLMAEAEKLAAGTELADRIAAPRYEKERLQIGMVAPEIVGVDLDGKPLKLSDFKGKVVVLDFWGDW